MSRGKYRTRAEAASARNEAERQSETLAEKCRRLEAQLVAERSDADAVISSLREQLSDARRQAREGTSDAHDAAMAALSKMRAERSGLRGGIRTQVFEVLKKHDAQLPVEGWADLAELFSTSVAAEGGRAQSREVRRAAKHSPGLHRESLRMQMGEK